MKKTFLVLLATAALAAVPGCSSISVQTDFDRDADFTKYRSYSWSDTQFVENPVVKERIEAAVDGQLQARGLGLRDKGADLTVAIQARLSKEKFVLQVFDDSPVAPGGEVWTRTTVGGEIPVGTIIVDLVDTARNALVWRGTASSELDSEASAEKKKERLDHVVSQLFARFPPKRK